MVKFSKCAKEWCHREDSFSEHSPDRKCIFHCDKSGWFQLRADGLKDWHHHMKDVERFWRELEQEKLSKGDYNCTSFIFPLFPASNPFSHTNAERIKSELRFTGARFLSRATFSSMCLESSAYFDYVIFSDSVEFSHVEFLKYADFSDTKFLGGVTFAGIFYEKANFRNASFSGSHATRFHPYHPDKQYAMFRGRTDFAGINFPRSVTFRHVDLSNVSFSASNIEEVTLLGCFFNRVRGRYELFDERKVFATSGGQIPDAYFGVVEDMYRQLKFNFENRRDWLNVSEFHISQMEIRRLRLRIDANDLKIRMEEWSQAKALEPPKRTRMEKLRDVVPKFYMPKWWKYALERFFLWGFNLISRYGERPDRALLWILLLLAFGAVGIFASQGCTDWNGAMLTTFRAVTFQQENRFDDIERNTQWLITFLRVGSAILLPLFLLALRRRFKR